MGVPKVEEINTYLEKVGMQAALQKAITDMVKEGMPPNPLEVVGLKLIEMHKAQLKTQMLDEIAKMQGPGGFDIVCVCCSNQSAENFWQSRLEQTIAEVTGQASAVLCVHEDWNGGAGNGLGTLYAYQKACNKG